MTPPLAPVKWTLAEYHQMISASILRSRRVELLNGEIVEVAPEGEPHAYYSGSIADYLRGLLGHRAQIRESHPITLPHHHSEPEPDIAVVQRLGKVYLQHHPYPENIFWLIGFSDTSLKKDLDPKAKLYAVAGIPEYWIVNLQKMSLQVLRDPCQGEYQSQVELTEGFLSPLAFPELELSVLELLA
ncbi:MAG: Uma2 family endonuclease [Cyanobacteriota bacterium]